MMNWTNFLTIFFILFSCFRCEQIQPDLLISHSPIKNTTMDIKKYARITWYNENKYLFASNERLNIYILMIFVSECFSLSFSLRRYTYESLCVLV